jgi:hypothetical protein
VIAAALLCLPVIGVLVASLLVPGRRQSPAKPVPTVALAPDRHNAVSAAVAYAQELAVTGVRSPDVYAKRLGAIVAPGAERAVRAAFERGAEQVRERIGPTGVLRAVPLGYRVDSFNSRAAEVSIWMVALAGGPGIEPTSQWRVLTLELAWTRQGWRVTDGRGAAGPSPRSPLALLTAEASTFKALNHVP